MSPPASNTSTSSRPFLGVHFVRCRVYSRIYRNAPGTAYAGRCPRCGARLEIAIGAQGIGNRFFLFDCP